VTVVVRTEHSIAFRIWRNRILLLLAHQSEIKRSCRDGREGGGGGGGGGGAGLGMGGQFFVRGSGLAMITA